jgi:hypothetical protein
MDKRQLIINIITGLQWASLELESIQEPTEKQLHRIGLYIIQAYSMLLNLFEIVKGEENDQTSKKKN